MVSNGASSKGTSMSMPTWVDKMMAVLMSSARATADFFGGGRNTMIWGVRVYLWPFLFMIFVLIIAWGIDMVFFP